MDASGGILRVQMLGGFQMFWNDQEITLKSGSATKAMQILQLLLYHAPKRLTTNALIDQIFTYDDILSPSNNLKASISLLRRQLRAAGLPETETIAFRDGGYVWAGALKLEVDAHRFEKAVKRGQGMQEPAARLRQFQAAAALYTGAFLPGLVGVDWAAPLSTYYAQMYGDVMRESIQLLCAQGDQERALALAEQAYSRLRTDEWQIIQMQCLMQLGRWDEAKQVYMDAVAAMSREYDVQPSQELLDQYRVICGQISNALGDFHDMLDSLREDEDIGGAYFCTYPGFIDSCRVTARSMERNGISCFLMLCCLTDGSGRAIQNPERLQDASAKLRDAIQRSVRSSDFFTQYNQSQYLIFLVGTCQENCSIVENRIENNFRAMSVRGVRLKFEAHSAMLRDMDEMLGRGAGQPAWK